MDSLEELALMGAIGLPIALVALGNVYLALTGESGTLLLPSIGWMRAGKAAGSVEGTAETGGCGES